MLCYAIVGLIDRTPSDLIGWGRRKVESCQAGRSSIGWRKNKVSEVNNFFREDIE